MTFGQHVRGIKGLLKTLVHTPIRDWPKIPAGLRSTHEQIIEPLLREHSSDQADPQS